MTKLEFIDREISSTEIDIWYSNSILKETPQKEELKREILEVKLNVLKQNMFMLQQIKNVLEAWEVSKRFNIKVEELVNGTYKAYIYYAGISIDVPLSKEEYINFKKALEVEDDLH